MEFYQMYRNIAIIMGASKTTDYTARELHLAKYAKALSHPARIAILNLLIHRKSCICGDIVEELPIAQSTVSQHLKELRHAGLIKGEIEGASICYCIDEKEWRKARLLMGEWFEKFQGNRENCCG